MEIVIIYWQKPPPPQVNANCKHKLFYTGIHSHNGTRGNAVYDTCSVSLGPHGAYFRMRKLKPEEAKASTVASVMRDKW